MQYRAKTPDEYIDLIPEERQAMMQQLREVIKRNLPDGFEEMISYGMIGYVVPHSLYPDGYHCDPDLPLPFMHIASQKNFIAVYHNGVYTNRDLMKWFVDEYPKHVKTKLDMGKSCMRFKKPEQLPLELIGKLASKMTPQQWISLTRRIFLQNQKS